MLRKHVAIIGAGPAGLVAAKSLLEHSSNLFNVSIFDSKWRLGGLWAVDDNDPRHGSSVHPSMHTNGSKFTVAFSDLSWSSVDLSTAEKEQSREQKPDTAVPMFPKAWMVRRYLETYASKFISTSCFRLGHQVTTLDKIKDANSSEPRWHLGWNVLETTTYEHGEFDYVIVATGFFSRPRSIYPTLTPKGGSSVVSDDRAKVIHSSQLQEISELFINGEIPKRGVVLVKGGGMSGVEAAAKVAAQISDYNHNEQSALHAATELRVVHVSSQHFYAVPLHVPQLGGNGPKPSFAPSDLVFYDVSRRTERPIVANIGLLPVEKARDRHAWMRSLVGEQRLRVLDGNPEYPVRVCICPSYDLFVRSGAIELSVGRSQSEVPPENGMIITSLKAHANNSPTVEDTVAVIDAGGYTSLPAVDFLSEDIKRALEYDESVERLPLVLDRFQTSNSRVPALGFVGFYEAPYWGVMEMQARYLASTWSSQLDEADSVRVGPSLDTMRMLRRAMSSGDTQVPQFWMGDYVGVMEELSRALHLKRDQSTSLTVPAAYTDASSDTEQSRETIQEVHDVMKDKTRFVSVAAFRAMQGQWMMQRKLESALEGFPSGTFDGVAHFHPREPTAEPFDGEYLYIETGALVTRSGLKMHASRRYVYRFSEIQNQISVWFVKDDGLTVDYQFHTLNVEETYSSRMGGWMAQADHLCVKDMYNTTYEWLFDGVGLEAFSVQHAVKGPRKDYISDTRFERQKAF